MPPRALVREAMRKKWFGQKAIGVRVTQSRADHREAASE
jgi:hypothetical protein